MKKNRNAVKLPANFRASVSRKLGTNSWIILCLQTSTYSGIKRLVIIYRYSNTHLYESVIQTYCLMQLCESFIRKQHVNNTTPICYTFRC